MRAIFAGDTWAKIVLDNRRSQGNVIVLALFSHPMVAEAELNQSNRTKK